MTTTLQIRAEIETAERFKKLWDRLKEADEKTTQGETLDRALVLLEQDLDGRVKITDPMLGQNVDVLA